MEALKTLILQTLKKEVVPAMGCTEPVAVALACAKASELSGDGELVDVVVNVSPNIYKNGLSVGIPHTEEVGLWISAAIGTINKSSEKGLEVLSEVKVEAVEKAKLIVAEKKIKLDIKDTDDKIFIEVICKKTSGIGHAIIKEKHNKFVYISKNGEVILDITKEKNEGIKPDNLIFTFKIKEIIESIESMTMSEIGFMLDGIKMNLEIANIGRSENLGMGVGFALNKNIENAILTDDLQTRAMILTAAASDARMSGISMPVMSSNGSGNNGLTAILPIAAYSQKFKVDDLDLAKAVAISHIINSYVKNSVGRLSAICGCGVAAGTGAGVGIAWLMGANYIQIEGVIQNMVANTSGMICDGAKVGCSLKLATSASAAVQSALLALSGSVVPSHNGIVGDTAEKTIQNLGVLSDKGMRITDVVILDIMKELL